MPVFTPSLTSFLTAPEVLACALTSSENFDALGGKDGLIVPNAGNTLPSRRDLVDSFSNARHKFPNASTFIWKVMWRNWDEVGSPTFWLYDMKFRLLLHPFGNSLAASEDQISLYLVADQACFVTFELTTANRSTILCHRFGDGDMWGESECGTRPEGEEWTLSVTILEPVARFCVLPGAKPVWCVENMKEKLLWARSKKRIWFCSDPIEISDTRVQVVLCLNPWHVFLKAQRGISIPPVLVTVQASKDNSFSVLFPAHCFSLTEAYVGTTINPVSDGSDLRVTLEAVTDCAPYAMNRISNVLKMPLFGANIGDITSQ